MTLIKISHIIKKSSKEESENFPKLLLKVYWVLSNTKTIIHILLYLAILSKQAHAYTNSMLFYSLPPPSILCCKYSLTSITKCGSRF